MNVLNKEKTQGHVFQPFLRLNISNVSVFTSNNKAIYISDREEKEIWGKIILMWSTFKDLLFKDEKKFNCEKYLWSFFS